MKIVVNENNKDVKVSRYMNFSRFIWLAQNQQLWLSRADLFEDPWELSLAGSQLEHLYKYRPIKRSEYNGKKESFEERTSRIINIWRQSTYINSWNKSPHESHALWRIFCSEKEGVLIQTTLGKLQQAVDKHSIYDVIYDIPGNKTITPTKIDLATQKRKMFDYEKEIRIIYDEKYEQEVKGYTIEFEMESTIDKIKVHPSADESFFQAVQGIVEIYLPELSDSVFWSEMRELPPF